MRPVFIALLLFLTAATQPPTEPTVRIGLQQNASTVTGRSAMPFSVEQRTTRVATFSPPLGLDPAVSGTLKKSDLQYRVTAELDGETLVVFAPGARVRIEPAGAPPEIETRGDRGAVEIFGHPRRPLTVVNELPLEDYPPGVAPNELNPAAFGQLEALKAQAVAARTYIVRNLGQYKNEGYDVCATDTCQVYFGVKTEDAMATQAVMDTRGVVATYDDKPINALYSSTCGGRTQDAGKNFSPKLPLPLATPGGDKHPKTPPLPPTRGAPDLEKPGLDVARVATFSDAARFMGLPDRGEPPSTEPAALASFVR